MTQEELKQTLKDKLKECDKDTLVDIIADVCSMYVRARAWFLLFPNICIYGFGNNKGFSKISAITLEWLYWQLTIQINRYYGKD